MTDRSGRPSFQNNRSAVISSDGDYRYRLWRTWDEEKPTVAFIMLNPSTADATTDDQTIRRCIGYAEDWGYGRLIVGNLFALRSTDPRQLDDHPAPVGPDNDGHLLAIRDEAEKIIVAWGTHGSLRDRDQRVAQLLDADFYALATTQEGQPVHPLYQPADIGPNPFTVDGISD
ncbi:DUF1643 domain-containing protein [Halococcus thailandensis]|uniref:DUF1643 domain-containing protein n=1 Tax=Halococcus thailandensis JCM 13552 TaxID=1227457 RepID=M0NFB8_9EURY|nr:DUF1643 domain-containing protein [Halococcus thailandensis]EMA56253.1 hypothetical protein C451_03294 [Halococcus thailandensis JCM 13552]